MCVCALMCARVYMWKHAFADECYSIFLPGDVASGKIRFGLDIFGFRFLV